MVLHWVSIKYVLRASRPANALKKPDHLDTFYEYVRNDTSKTGHSHALDP